MRRVLFLLREAFSNIRTNRTTTLIGIVTTAFTLACFGVFLLLYLNLKGLAGGLKDDIQIILYLEDGLSSPSITALRRQLERDEAVAAVSFTSRDEALTDFQAEFPSESSLLEGLGTNPLPASFVISMASDFQSPRKVQGVVQRFRTVPGVDQVRYSREWVEHLATLVGYLELVAMVVGVVFTLASVTIIANTIRLTLYTRREEIDILRLVGATNGFIRVPYVVEGAVLGGLGGALSLLILKGGFELFKLELSSSVPLFSIGSTFEFFSTQVACLIIAGGLMLGCAGSYLSLTNFMKVKG